VATFGTQPQQHRHGRLKKLPQSTDIATVSDIRLPDLRARVQRAGEEWAWNNEKRSTPGVVLTLTVFALGITQWISVGRYLVFSMVVLLLNVASAFAARKCIALLRESRDYLRWSHLQITLSGLGGLTWGIGSLVMRFPPDPAPHAILVIFQATLMTITTMTMASNTSRYLGFVGPLIIGAIVANVLVGDRLQLTVAFGMVVFGLFLWGLQREFKKTYTDNIALRFTNEALLEELATANTQLAQDNTELHQQVVTDALTRVSNRKGWERSVDETIGDGFEATKTAMLIIDVDDFKAVNDTYGHDAGDRVLMSLAKRLRSCVKDIDTVARLGGDEFAVLLRNISSDTELAMISDRIQTHLAHEFQHDDISTQITISLGSARHSPGESSGDVLLRADANLYELKRARKSAARRISAGS
jgi:diguanylate cyclase (GGDEF)-like protein